MNNLQEQALKKIANTIYDKVEERRNFCGYFQNLIEENLVLSKFADALALTPLNEAAGHGNIHQNLLDLAIDAKCSDIVNLFIDKMSPEKVIETYNNDHSFEDFLISINSSDLIKIAKMNGVTYESVRQMAFNIRPLTNPDLSYVNLFRELFDIWYAKIKRANSLLTIHLGEFLLIFLQETIDGYDNVREDMVKHILSKWDNKAADINEGRWFLRIYFLEGNEGDKLNLSQNIVNLIERYADMRSSE